MPIEVPLSCRTCPIPAGQEHINAMVMDIKKDGHGNKEFGNQSRHPQSLSKISDAHPHDQVPKQVQPCANNYDQDVDVKAAGTCSLTRAAHCVRGRTSGSDVEVLVDHCRHVVLYRRS